MSVANEIELDLNDSAPAKKSKVAKPSLGETLYAQRLEAGLHDIPVVDDPAFSVGTQEALAEIRNSKSQPEPVDAIELLLPVMLELGIRADLTPAELFSLGVEFHNGAMVLAVKAGVAFMATQNALHESDTSNSVTFKSWIESNGLTKQRVYEAISLAKAYMAIPAEQRKSFIAMGKFKAIKLASLDAEVLSDLANDNAGFIEGAGLLSRKELQETINRLNTDLGTANNKLKGYEKKLAEPLLSRQTDALMQVSLNSEAMSAAGLDQLSAQIRELLQGGDHLSERMFTLHSCLLAINSRMVLALNALDDAAETFNIQLPDRPKMALSEDMARDYLAAHTGYVETAIELAKKAIQGRADILGRERGRPRKTK